MSSKQHHSSDAAIYYFRLQNITCASCVQAIEKRLKAESGILKFQTNFPERLLTVETQESPKDIQKILSELGYPGTLLSSPEILPSQQETRQQLKRLAIKIIIPLVWGVLLFGFEQLITHKLMPAFSSVGDKNRQKELQLTDKSDILLKIF